MNPYSFGSSEWRAYERGRSEANDKWRQALIKPSPAIRQKWDELEARR